MDSREGPWLYGYGLTGVGSLQGDEPIKVGPLAKVNFLVGRNNHGKSTVMRAAEHWVAKGGRVQAPDFKTVTLLPVPRQWLQQTVQGNSMTLEVLIAEGRISEVEEDRMGVWIEGNAVPAGGEGAGNFVRSALGFSYLPGFTAATSASPTAVVTIPAFRELRPFLPEGISTEISGAQRRTTIEPRLAHGEGLVAELGTWFAPANPGSPEYDQGRLRWEVLTNFMREVLEEPAAELEVANNQQDLHVKLSQAGRMLHIDTLGDGIKQVLMIAAATVLFDNHLVLLEEPEIHLHAGLQRKLMRFLANHTENQYIIATHSAHVLDLPGAAIFHVTHDGTTTRVAPAVRASQVQSVCQDLGYMASDLLQANYTIWVEGPSDRIYWRRWLSLIDPHLVEGVHYAIMAYGGSLIKDVHLEDEPQLETDLVQLLQLGRSCAVIADSDKSHSRARLNKAISRLTEEATKPGSGHLVVCGWASTVENLLPRDLFRTVLEEVHPRASKKLLKSAHTPFTDPFANMSKTSYSKVAIARRVADRLDASHIDLKLRPVVENLAKRIRDANGLAAGSLVLH